MWTRMSAARSTCSRWRWELGLSKGSLQGKVALTREPTLTSSLNDAHCLGGSFIGRFYHSPFPWPLSYAFPRSLPTLYLWNLLPHETGLLSKQALGPTHQSLKVAFSAVPFSTLKCSVWDDCSKVFPKLAGYKPALSSGSQGCCFRLLFHHQMFYR